MKKEPLIWRRRHCPNCGSIFTTRERPDLSAFTVIKKDKTLQPFSRAKLFVSVMKSLDHSKKAAEASDALTDTITRLLYPLIKDNQLPSANIARTVMTVLKRFDASAFVKYASYQSDLLSTRELKKALSDY